MEPIDDLTRDNFNEVKKENEREDDERRTEEKSAEEVIEELEVWGGK